jgi:hypothetical protein
MGWGGRDQATLDYLNAWRDLRPKDVRLLRPRSATLLFLRRPDEAEQNCTKWRRSRPPVLKTSGFWQASSHEGQP